MCDLLGAAGQVLGHREVHGVHVVEVHLLELGVFLVLLKFLVAICLVHLLGVDWELHHHVLTLAVESAVICFSPMALVAYLLYTHEWSQTSNRPNGANG